MADIIKHPGAKRQDRESPNGIFHKHSYFLTTT